jgi:hypothetical protein
MTGGRRRRRIRTAAWLAAALALTGLTACTHDDPPPQTSATTTPTTTTPTTGSTPSPTITPPTAPKAAPTQKSAEAFVRYFWAVHNYSYATLNTDLFKSISEPDCKFCASTIRDIAGLKSAGTTVNGSAIELALASAPPSKIKTGIIVAEIVSQRPGHLIRTDGTIQPVPAMKETQGYIGLVWTDARWLVDDVAINKSGKAS